MSIPSNTVTFHGLGIAPKLLEILNQKGFVTPTPIQQQAIPVAVGGKDVMGIAQTGTGKTLAFGVPMLQIIARTKTKGLVVLPTRELALQVNESLQNVGQALGLKTAVLIGGESMSRQLSQLKKDPHITIATPGRLIDHLEQKTASLSKVGILVLDEADRMLDMGFKPQLTKILQHVPKERQTMLFSATMPQEIVQIATSYMKLPVRVEVAPAGTAAASVSQEIYFVEKQDKLNLLARVLSEYKGSTLVFSRTKFGAKKIARQVRTLGIPSAEIHSNRSQSQRIEALTGFKLGTYRVLVATDIAARGIDVSGIELVVNYDLPENPEDYVHRIGRTGRAGQAGHAISFATSDQRRDVKDIERLIKKQLPIKQSPAGLPAVPKVAESRAYDGRGRDGSSLGKAYGRDGRRTERQERSQPRGSRQGFRGKKESGRGYRSRDEFDRKPDFGRREPGLGQEGEPKKDHGRKPEFAPSRKKSRGKRSFKPETRVLFPRLRVRTDINPFSRD